MKKDTGYFHLLDMNIGGAGMTFDEAKKLYFKYDCSLFAMAREEDKEVYKNYKLLGIPDIVEEEWREELFIVLWEQFKIERTGSLFDRMAEIAEKKYNNKMLFILKEALDEVDYENLQVRACISEAVIGRKALSERSGMIFGAYDIGEKDLAKDFLQFILNLLSDCTLTQEMLPRFERSITNCRILNEQLGLGIYI